MYGIYHIYDVDGGYGDAVTCEDLLFITADKAKAEAYTNRWSNQHVYARPYADLECGLLVVREVQELGDIEEEPPLPWFCDRYEEDELDEESES